jgi:hypothetical protein
MRRSEKLRENLVNELKESMRGRQRIIGEPNDAEGAKSE